MTWAVWLAVPVVATVLAALWSWARSRPVRPPDTRRSMQEHSDYLDALARTARGTHRASPSAETPASPD